MIIKTTGSHTYRENIKQKNFLRRKRRGGGRELGGGKRKMRKKRMRRANRRENYQIHYVHI